MNRQVNIAELFPKHLFWDLDPSKLNQERDMDIIIPRAMFATTQESFTNDIKKLEKLYSKDQILLHLKTTKERISNDVCNMVAKRYKVEAFARFK